MDVYKAVLTRRSIRCFKRKKVSFRILSKLVNAARLAPSGANLQAGEFIVVDKPEIAEKLFPALSWAGYIRPQGDPAVEGRPVAYIVVLINAQKHPLCPEADAAASVENILLVAHSQGLGGCWLGAIKSEQIRALLKVPAGYEIKYVVALGYPDEGPKLEQLRGCVKYWKDKSGRLHVPKRSLKEVLHHNRY